MHREVPARFGRESALPAYLIPCSGIFNITRCAPMVCSTLTHGLPHSVKPLRQWSLRRTDELLPDDPESKVNTCLDNIHRIWEASKEQRSTQLVFCDLSTPHGDGKFNVYDDLKSKLVRMGVPEAEIAFIHDAKTEAQKAALFTNVRSGNVRILLGSTAKMGAGTNVQKRLIAEHHLDIPWRPSDIEQREGRILRQGNENDKVDIFRYVTENTFDSYMWQTIESKQKVRPDRVQ